MAAFITVFNKLAVLGLLIILGYCIARFKIMEEKFAKYIVEFLIKIAIPIMAIVSLQMEFSTELLLKGITILLVSSAAFLLCLLFGYGTLKIFRVPYEKKGMWLYTCMLSNTVFMGIPVLQSMYGDAALFYCIILNLVGNIFTFTIGLWVVKKYSSAEKNSVKMDFKKTFVTPLNCSILLGALLFVLQIRLPEVLVSSGTLVSSTMTPLAMIYIGMTLAKSTIMEMLGDWQVYALSVIRLLVLPVIFYFILRPFIKEEMMLAAIVISGVAMPAPAMGALFVGEYGGDERFSSKLVFLSTLICGVTIPLLAGILFS